MRPASEKICPGLFSTAKVRHVLNMASGPGLLARSTYRLIALPLPLFVTITVLGLACAAERPFVWSQDLPPIAVKGEGLIHARDTIVVAVREQPSMSGELVVRDDGGVMVPTLGDVAVEGRTPADVAAELQARLKDLVVRPLVAVSIARVATIRVSVVGQVKTPGVYELGRDRSVAAALAAAGWLGDFAAADRIFVVRRGEGELRVRFRAREITSPDPRVARFRLNDGDVVSVE